MKKAILSIAFLSILLNSQAQEASGTVVYYRKVSWVKVIQRLPYMSREEKEREMLTWGKEEENSTYKGDKLRLTFTPKKSLYTHAEEQGQSTDGQWSWRQEDFVVGRDFEKETKTELIEMIGKTYLIEGPLETPKWRILQQIKDIGGHVCMKAETEDTLKKQKIVAWFAQDIISPAGPEMLFGLPGLILELNVNDGEVIVEADKISLMPITTEVELPKKMKGKKITPTDYNALIYKHIQVSIKSQQNPYWSFRY